GTKVTISSEGLLGVPFSSTSTLPLKGFEVVKIPSDGILLSLSNRGTTTERSSSTVTKSSCNILACCRQTTVKLGRAKEFPTFVKVAAYRSTFWVAITLGLNGSPLRGGDQLTVAAGPTFWEMSSITSLSGPE